MSALREFPRAEDEPSLMAEELHRKLEAERDPDARVRLAEQLDRARVEARPQSAPRGGLPSRIPDLDGRGDDASRRRVVLTWASEVTPEPIEWLWPGRLPLHDLAVLAGEPGLGKSTTTTELAARITRGELDGALHGRPASVLIASAEDHFESIIWGRLKAAGADLSRVANVGISDADMFTIPGDLDRLAVQCAELRDTGRPAALLVVDPISAYLGGIDTHRDAAVRGALAPLAKLAQEQHLCVLVIAHLNKASAGRLLERITGSGAFGAAPRSVLAFARDPGDPDGEHGQHRVLVHVKSNHGAYAPTLAAHIETVAVPEVESTVSRLMIDGESDVSPEDLHAGQQDQAGGDQVRDAILDVLGAGERLASEVKGEVSTRCRVSAKTVERQASDMEKHRELARESRGFPSRAYWRITQQRHASSDTAVSTEPVATEQPQRLRVIAGSEASSRDTSGGLSLLGSHGSGASIDYRPICRCADGGLWGGGERCERCYGLRPDVEATA